MKTDGYFRKYISYLERILQSLAYKPRVSPTRGALNTGSGVVLRNSPNSIRHHRRETQDDMTDINGRRFMENPLSYSVEHVDLRGRRKSDYSPDYSSHLGMSATQTNITAPPPPPSAQKQFFRSLFLHFLFFI